MNQHTLDFISNDLFLERKKIFTKADIVFYHPGHFPELNKFIVNIYMNEGFGRLMIPSIHNKFLNHNEYEYHKNILVDQGLPENIIYPITGTHSSVKEVVQNALILKKDNENKVLLAGKSFFCKRFLLLASLFADKNTLLDVFPMEDERGINKDRWHETKKGRQRVFNEISQINQIIGDLTQ